MNRTGRDTGSKVRFKPNVQKLGRAGVDAYRIGRLLLVHRSTPCLCMVTDHADSQQRGKERIQIACQYDVVEYSRIVYLKVQQTADPIRLPSTCFPVV